MQDKYYTTEPHPQPLNVFLRTTTKKEYMEIYLELLLMTNILDYFYTLIPYCLSDLEILSLTHSPHP